MIKAVDLVWKQVYDDNGKYICVCKSEGFLLGAFYIYDDSTKKRFDVTLTADISYPSIWNKYNFLNLEDAKQACQDYLQKIAEEIVK